MVSYMGQMLERFQKTTKSVSHTTCLLMDRIYIIYAVLTVLLLYIQLFRSSFDWLCFTSIILGFIIPFCDIRECLVLFSTSVRFGRYWRLFLWDFRNNSNTLTCSFPFTNLSAIKLNNFEAFELPPPAPDKLDNWFYDAGLLSCRPTFAGFQSPSGFVFTPIKLSWSWFGSRCVVKTRSASLLISSSLGFSTNNFTTLVCCRVDPRLLASDLLLALCLHL
jgi:hypothetical protein